MLDMMLDVWRVTQELRKFHIEHCSCQTVKEKVYILSRSAVCASFVLFWCLNVLCMLIFCVISVNSLLSRNM